MNEYGVLLAFLVSLSSMALSLFYSEVIGFPPCELCILERCFIYPQVVLFGILLGKKYAKGIVNLTILLSGIGSLVSIYHVYIEHGGSSALSCASDSITAITCSARYVYEFGYVSIPVMALSAQLLILLLAINYRYFLRK